MGSIIVLLSNTRYDDTTTQHFWNHRNEKNLKKHTQNTNIVLAINIMVWITGVWYILFSSLGLSICHFILFITSDLKMSIHVLFIQNQYFFIVNVVNENKFLKWDISNH